MHEYDSCGVDVRVLASLYTHGCRAVHPKQNILLYLKNAKFKDVPTVETNLPSLCSIYNIWIN